MRAALLWSATALALVATTGCAETRLRREAVAAVRTYNEAVIVAYRTNDARGLEKVAGPKELRKLIALIDLKRGGKLALESELKELEVLAVEAKASDVVVVRTRERWRYWDRALRPGMPAGPVFVADMWMTWRLERHAGRLKVAGGTTDRSEYLEPKGFTPGSASRKHGDGKQAPPGREAGLAPDAEAHPLNYPIDAAGAEP